MLKNEKGFTLIEMMIVLMIISILLMITIPNVTKNNKMINSKGCDAYISMVQAQVQAFEVDNDKLPTTIQELINEKYIKEGTSSCGKDKQLTIDADGMVVLEDKPASETTAP
ncbi:competence type IV pilus major pilin ComGC [Neobacillus sp. D3-1R]|uniref:competence type IV pilus major pilin ComGC n=1 Tax=Neobacillus sp. D3-1R TaxID=3445778 RepID=UPI003F9FBA45